MELLIISGMSGGGKSQAASFLEDMDYYIVDNMPAEMILKFAELCSVGGSRFNRVALVYDVRSDESFEPFFQVLDTLKERGYSYRLLFLEADVSTIIRRYKETRRLHPLMEKAHSLEEATLMEQEKMQPIRSRADIVLNTTTFSIAKLRGELLRLLGDDAKPEEMTVNMVSFGFKHGLPLEADLVFDVRFMPNPYYIEALRDKTGLDPEVRDYVLSFHQTEEFLERLSELLRFVLPLYREEGKTVLVIAIGCTGGHHRSVAITHSLTDFVRSLGYSVAENHRDMTRN